MKYKTGFPEFGYFTADFFFVLFSSLMISFSFRGYNDLGAIA
jgi:hypothetical protein